MRKTDSTQKTCLELVLFSEADFLQVFEKLNKRGVSIEDCYTPYPINVTESGLPEKANYIPLFGLLGGVGGLLFGYFIQYFVSNAYPMTIGGKPDKAMITWVPVIFECIILVAFIGLSLSYFFQTRNVRKRRIRSSGNKDGYTTFTMSISLFPEELKVLLSEIEYLQENQTITKYEISYE